MFLNGIIFNLNYLVLSLMNVYLSRLNLIVSESFYLTFLSYHLIVFTADYSYLNVYLSRLNINVYECLPQMTECNTVRMFTSSYTVLSLWVFTSCQGRSSLSVSSETVDWFTSIKDSLWTKYWVCSQFRILWGKEVKKRKYRNNSSDTVGIRRDSS